MYTLKSEIGEKMGIIDWDSDNIEDFDELSDTGNESNDLWSTEYDPVGTDHRHYDRIEDWNHRIKAWNSNTPSWNTGWSV